MTAEITAEQAPQIHDLESYKTVTGAKRFKRTAEEMQLGLSPEAALKRRLAAFDPNWLDKNPEAKALVMLGIEQAKARMFTNAAEFVKRQTYGTGEILIRIRPVKGVSPDYFEHLPSAEIVVEQDDKFYGWLDVMLSGRYTGTVNAFFAEVLDEGLGEKISNPRIAAEPQETENVESTSSTAKG